MSSLLILYRKSLKESLPACSQILRSRWGLLGLNVAPWKINAHPCWLLPYCFSLQKKITKCKLILTCYHYCCSYQGTPGHLLEILRFPRIQFKKPHSSSVFWSLCVFLIPFLKSALGQIHRDWLPPATPSAFVLCWLGEHDMNLCNFPAITNNFLDLSKLALAWLWKFMAVFFPRAASRVQQFCAVCAERSKNKTKPKQGLIYISEITKRKQRLHLLLLLWSDDLVQHPSVLWSFSVIYLAWTRNTLTPSLALFYSAAFYSVVPLHSDWGAFVFQQDHHVPWCRQGWLPGQFFKYMCHNRQHTLLGCGKITQAETSSPELCLLSHSSKRASVNVCRRTKIGSFGDKWVCPPVPFRKRWARLWRLRTAGSYFPEGSL